MAAASVAFDGTRINNADAVGTIWSGLGGGGAKAVLEPDFVYQGTGSISGKVGTSEKGVGADIVATTDYSTTPRVWLAKVIATNNAALNVKGSTGGILEIGSGGLQSAYDRYYVVGGDTYPILGGWLIIPIDPNGTPSATPGTAPTLTAIDYYGWLGDFTATSKSENLAMDSIDSIEIGTGLTLTDGIGGTDGNFELFATTDEDSALNNRWGVVSTREGILYVTGVLTVGDSGTGAEFDSIGEVVVWPDAEFVSTAGFFGLDINLQNSATVVSITSGTFISRGTSGGASDTRAVVEFIGTTATLDAEISSSNFQNLSDFICTSKVHVDGGLIETVNLTQGTAHIENCAIVTNPLTSIACITDPTFGTTSGLHDIDFVFGSGGHALELSTINATVTLTNITFTGYGATASDSAAIDVTAASGTTTINWTGGTEPTYKTAGATVVVVNAVTVSVTALDANTGLGILNARLSLEAASGGSLAAGLSTSITTATTTATATATAHGMATGDTVIIRGANEDELNGQFVITVTGVNTFTYTIVSIASAPGTGTITSTAQILTGLTSAAGLIEDTGFNYGSDQPVTGRIRKATSSPYYKTAGVVGTISGNGFSANISMIPDE